MTTRSIIQILLCIMVAGVMTTSSQQAKPDDALKNFKTLYEQELKQNGIVGSSFVFLRDNKVFAEDFYGPPKLPTDSALIRNPIFPLPSHTTHLTSSLYISP